MWYLVAHVVNEAANRSFLRRIAKPPFSMSHTQAQDTHTHRETRTDRLRWKRVSEWVSEWEWEKNNCDSNWASFFLFYHFADPKTTAQPNDYDPLFLVAYFLDITIFSFIHIIWDKVMVFVSLIWCRNISLIFSSSFFFFWIIELGSFFIINFLTKHFWT